MSKHVIEAMREKRVGAYERMKEINDEALSAERDFTAEEQQEFDRLDGEFESLGKKIDRAEKIEGFSPKMVPAKAEGDEPADIAERKVEAFDAYLRHSDAEKFAALQVGTDSEGGYTVPEEWENRLVEQSREFGVVRNLATVIQTSDARQINIPTIATFPTAAATAEEAAFTQSEPTFGEKTLGGWKYGSIAKVSDELRQDSMFDIDGLVQRLAGQAITLAEDVQFVQGDGTTEPEGLETGLSTGKTTASATAITADELIDLYHSVTSPYRMNASWILNDSTAAAIRKLKSSDNQYIWQPGLAAGQPDVLLGRPVYTDSNVAAIATGNDTVFFGDFARAVIVRNAGGIAVKVLEELYAANGQVGIRVHRRSDSAIVDANAAKKLTQA